MRSRLARLPDKVIVMRVGPVESSGINRGYKALFVQYTIATAPQSVSRE